MPRPSCTRSQPIALRLAVIAFFLWAGPLFATPLFAAEVQGENWTRFRGPNGSGIASESVFPATWTEDDYLWKKTLPGVGHGSPVGWKNRVFVTSGDPETGAITLHCLATDDGESLWKREFASQTYAMHVKNAYASTTPTVDAQQVYLTWAAGGKIHCTALTHQGDEKWDVELGNFAGQHGFAASPIVVDIVVDGVVHGVVCVQVDQEEDDFLAGIDAQSGKVLWRAGRPAGKVSYATPCVVSLADDRSAVLTQSTAGGMQAVDVQTGKILWQDAEVFPARCVSSPFVARGKVFGACGGGGGGKLLAIVDLPLDLSLDKQPPRTKPLLTKQILTKQIPYVPTPLVTGDWLFLWHDQGKVSLVDLSSATPQKSEWTERIGGKFFGSPILAGDKIYCLSDAGLAVVIAADREFKLLGKTDLGEPTHATPAVHQGRMYLRTESSLACLPAE